VIEVERPGALTTVQDLGRRGHAASGVPRGGAFDPRAARLANRLVGNPDDAALLEITLAGPTLVLEGVRRVALVGDPFEVEIEALEDSSPPEALLRSSACLARESASCFRLGNRTRLAIGRARAGVRAWLALEGGVDVPRVLGSRSTDLAGGFGGLDGRALKAGDRLLTFPSRKQEHRSSSRERVPVDARPESRDGKEAETGPEGVVLVRVLAGPDRDLLLEQGLASLRRGRWRVDPDSDRRGVRLAGGSVALRSHEPLRSQPTLPGAVQATPSGGLVVLGVDAPVTGGYPWVAQVIEADLGRLAHLAPGSEVRLVEVDPDAAERARVGRRAELDRLAPEIDR